MTSRRNQIMTLFAAATLVVGLAACGDDDDDETAADDTEETTDDTSSDEEGGPPEVNPCADGVSPEDAGLPPAEEPADGATEVTVMAADYSFDGLDAITATGTYAITLENEGEELHEVAIQYIDPSETRSVEEMLASEEQPETVTDVAFGFACPGESTVFNADLSEPGRYVALCFIPTGTTAETDPADFESGGAPHAMNGMVVEFEVS
jgi:hypothetical protein